MGTLLFLHMLSHLILLALETGLLLLDAYLIDSVGSGPSYKLTQIFLK